MKLVIKLGSASLAQDGGLRKFGTAVRQLLAEGHQVAIVHGRMIPLADSAATGHHSAHADSCSQTGDAALMEIGACINKKLVALLGRTGVPAIGLCGADGGIVRARKKGHTSSGPHDSFETALVDPFWLETIARNGAVPIIANIVLTPGHSYACVCADQLASTCAVSWHADALIFLTYLQGIRNDEGSVMRWLESEQVTSLIESSPSRPVLSKLTASREALKRGVHRVRIFPMCDVGSLAVFYNERIDCGTEIVESI